MFKPPRKNYLNLNHNAAPSFHGRKLMGIIATSANTKVLRIPMEIYSTLVEPFSKNQL